MDASVVVATYNRARLLERALGSILEQKISSGLAWELVVVDNNSRDQTRDVVARVASASEVPVVYAFEPRQGKSHALNLALATARGTVLAFTDDDCRPDPTWLAELLGGLERSRVDGIGGRIVPDWAKQPPAWLSEEAHLYTVLALHDTVRPRVFEARNARGPYGIWGANMAFRRSVFNRVGGFNAALGPRGTRPFNGEEPELISRALRAGFRVRFDPSPVVRHFVGEERMRKRYFRRWAFYRGVAISRQQGVAPRHVLGVPPYMVNMLGQAIRRWLIAGLHRDREAFCLERDVIELVGCLGGHLDLAWRQWRRGPKASSPMETTPRG